MTQDITSNNTPKEIDQLEANEWIEALKALRHHRGDEYTDWLLTQVVDESRREGLYVPHSMTTAYRNTILPEEEPEFPGDPKLETHLTSIVRWNAIAVILKANKDSAELGGHIASFQSAATLYDIGYEHFWRAPSEEHDGDLIYFQGHSAPGIYARAFVEGRITEEQLLNFRQETGGNGLSSYPHPWLMPNFWQFPTVSMGLGPLTAIYQARFLRYLEHRGIAKTDGRKVWAFLGDGEMDEPESLGAISLAGREQLENLIFVINCNLQRLDGPVRGNGKIIQELESVFRGAGWNVIKVIWGGEWDEFLAKDHDGLLLKRMEECLDGEYQNLRSKDGAYIREHFFGKYEALRAMVADMSDEEIFQMKRGGHDPLKVYAAYASAVAHKGQPTVILAKTIKGYGMGESGEGQMIAHQAKKMTHAALQGFKERFDIPVAETALDNLPFIPLPKEEQEYLHKRRKALGGYLPTRRSKSSVQLPVPEIDRFKRLLKSTGSREISTTMAFVQMLSILVKDDKIGKRIVPIVPDESRTFGMEGMFRQLGIYSSVGQLYQPQDADQLLYYREDKDGQVIQEGINEGGAISSWIAAATSYSNNNEPMLPFYIFYSMFGLQRTLDLAWAAADSRARGFLMGGTSGRTTLNGEGLQHEDGHSHILASIIPNCVSYDPCYSYEMITIVHEGMRRMLEEQEDVFYYITLMNENYQHLDMPKGIEEGILKGLYLLRRGGRGKKDAPRVQLMGSGAILREVEAAAELLKADYGIVADVWSATSFNELRRDAMEVERWNRLHPGKRKRIPYVVQCLKGHSGPVVAATDYIRAFPDQIQPYIDRPMTSLGTDGFGRSDYRRALRRFFEVDRYHIAYASLHALVDLGQLKPSVLKQALKRYNIAADNPAPWTV